MSPDGRGFLYLLLPGSTKADMFGDFYKVTLEVTDSLKAVIVELTDYLQGMIEYVIL